MVVSKETIAPATHVDRKNRAPGFCRRADIPNVATALFAPVLFFVPYFVDFTVFELVAYILVLIALIGRASYLLHWHVHRPFTSVAAFNLLLDLCLGLATGMTASNWRIQHVHGHHRGSEIRYRAPVSMIEDYSACRALSFCVRSLWPTFFEPVREAFEKGVLGSATSPLNYRWAFVEQSLLVALVAFLLLLRPWLTMFYVLPWYASVFFISRYVDYLNHYGCDESGADPSTLANNTSHAWFNFLTGNFGYHTAHHLHPTAHWTQLPDLHDAIAKHVAPDHLKDFSWSFLHLPQHIHLARSGRM